jgi:hypothetical protein
MPQAAVAQGISSGLGILGDIGQYGTTAGALGTATDVQNRAYTQSIQGMLQQLTGSQQAWSPYQKLGTQALTQLTTPGGIQADPSMQFALKTGTDILNQQAAARGQFFSPQTIQALTAYGTNVGSEYYQQAFQNLMQQAGLGERATGAATTQQTDIQSMLNNLYLGQAGMQASSALSGAAAQNQLWGGITGGLQGAIGSMNPVSSFAGGGKGGGGSMAGAPPATYSPGSIVPHYTLG